MTRQVTAVTASTNMISRLQELIASCAAEGCLVDGMPKDIGQAEAMMKIGHGADKLMVVDITREEILEFHASRVFDPETKITYHLKTNPPPAEVAERCTQTAMDQEDAVKGRIDPYYESLPKLLELFGDKVIKIKGTTLSGGPEEAAMFEEAKTALGC